MNVSHEHLLAIKTIGEGSLIYNTVFISVQYTELYNVWLSHLKSGQT